MMQCCGSLVINRKYFELMKNQRDEIPSMNAVSRNRNKKNMLIAMMVCAVIVVVALVSSSPFVTAQSSKLKLLQACMLACDAKLKICVATKQRSCKSKHTNCQLVCSQKF